MEKIQRFGGAMFTPVLLFSFSGIMVALCIIFKNPMLVGSIATEGTAWYSIWSIIENGAWTVFNQMELLFVIGLPIGLAKKANARAAMEAFVIYITFNYFVSGMLQFFGKFFGVTFGVEVGGESGLKMIAGIKTLDTGIIGAILISAIVVYLHDRYFDKKLPDFLGIFQGSSFIVILGFFGMLPIAFLICLIWPKIQMGISSLQGFLAGAGIFGVWLYTFLERILIPTGLHHFIYTPFVYGPAVVEEGITKYWMGHLQEFAQSTRPLKELFPEGGFALHGNSKIFAAPGIAAAFYLTAKPEKKKTVLAILIPATLTAVLAGITEPLEFTFLFISPPLLAEKVHASKSSVLRTTKKLGFSGYSEFKYFLRNSFEERNSTEEKNKFQKQKDDINQTINFLDNYNFNPINKLLDRSEIIYVYGTGYSQRKALEEFSKMMLNMEKRVIIIPNKTEFDMAMPMIREKDCIIIASLSGETEDVKENLTTLSIRKIPTITITAPGDNYFARHCDHHLTYFCDFFTVGRKQIVTQSLIGLNVLVDYFIRKYGEFTAREE